MKSFLCGIFLLLSIFNSVAAQCNEDDHHPENGGYFFVGVAGLSDIEAVDSVHGQKLPNATWAPGYYPYGQNLVCTSGRNCFAPCDQAPGCPQFFSTHTCSILKFCPPEGATASQIVWELPNLEATEKCDFTNAVNLGTMGTDPTTGCFEYVFEEDHELTEYYFASQEGCTQGQRIAVKIQDFTLTASQCEVIGLTTPRICNCDCTLQKTPSMLGEPCRTAFVNSCLSVVLEGECCDTGTCLSKLEDFNHIEGRAKELNRRLQCDDSMPGVCYNEDRKGTDTNGQGSKNCCTHTCSVCGTELSPFARWKPCTSLDGEGKTGKCGFLSRYDSEPYECDFSLCDSSDYWNPTAKPFRIAAGLETDGPNNDNPNKPTDQTSSGKTNETYTPVVILFILLSSLLAPF